MDSVPYRHSIREKGRERGREMFLINDWVCAYSQIGAYSQIVTTTSQQIFEKKKGGRIANLKWHYLLKGSPRRQWYTENCLDFIEVEKIL